MLEAKDKILALRPACPGGLNVTDLLFIWSRVRGNIVRTSL